jgi:hypothetical protein
MWPEYKMKPLDRELYLFQDNMFIDRNGVVVKVSSFDDFLNFMNDNNALALSVFNIVDDFEWITEAIEHDKCTVVCTKDGIATMIRMKFKNSTRWLVNSSVWISPDEFDKVRSHFLEDLDSFFSGWVQEFV